MRIDKISDMQLKVTDEVIKYINKTDLEDDKAMLEARLVEIKVLLNTFAEVK